MERALMCEGRNGDHGSWSPRRSWLGTSQPAGSSRTIVPPRGGRSTSTAAARHTCRTMALGGLDATAGDDEGSILAALVAGDELLGAILPPLVAAAEDEDEVQDEVDA